MSDTITKHFVTFYSPGTLVSEDRTLPIDAWEPEAALALLGGISERYGATPYGFRFTTRSRGPDDLDSKTTARSSFYWLGGKIETLDEIEARNDPADSILIANMKSNGYPHVMVNTNSWSFTGPMNDDDVVLDYTPPAREPAP